MKRSEVGEVENSYTPDAEQARDQLVQANLRLVIAIARKFQGYNIPLEDLIQEGNSGLIRAASKFDYRWGHRFSSYASWWIRQAMVYAHDNSSRLIRLPSYFIARMKKYDTVYARLCQELQREPYPEEIAAVSDLTVKQVEDILVSKVEAVSMDSLLENEYSAETLGDLIDDLIEDSTNGEQEVSIAKIIHKDLIVQFLKSLPEREQKLLKMRFGLEDGEPKTLREVSLALEVTRERVRQLEIEAIKRLRVLHDEIG
ncbi:MAG: sigma-70 family RNA polymerase sigma factor [Candidatus Poribacteria bacterium]|nr:sigma-70 family RNA polymerase sigma factor [Candidatus Poribacteria bacterium]